MSAVHLIGGGRDDALATGLFAAFVRDAEAHRRNPVIRVLLVIEADDTESVERYRRVFALAGAGAIEIRAIVEGERFDADVLDGADALAIGGGLTPAYADAVDPIGPAIRDRVADGMPYLGFSAGAAIAAREAIVGGWLLAGSPIGDEHAGEELDDLTVRAGIGLVPFAVDVHAAQWGTLSRLVAAVEAGLVAEGYAIDEHTALVVHGDGGAPLVTGVGAAWHAIGGDPTSVRRVRADVT